MSPSALALIGYAAWTVLLTAAIVFYRTGVVLVRKRAANDFRPSGEDVSPFSNRLCRAHANWVLVARVAQSIVHLISTSEAAVSLRATLLLVQLGVEAYWVVQLGILGFG